MINLLAELNLQEEIELVGEAEGGKLDGEKYIHLFHLCTHNYYYKNVLERFKYDHLSSDLRPAAINHFLHPQVLSIASDLDV